MCVRMSFWFKKILSHINLYFDVVKNVYYVLTLVMNNLSALSCKVPPHFIPSANKPDFSLKVQIAVKSEKIC